MSFDKLVVVTRRTRLDALVERFNTRAQARFYLEHAGLDFLDYQAEHDTYQRSLSATLSAVRATGLKVQVMERALVPTYLFSPSDVVVVLGQDGTVANAAKYVGAQPLVGVNPDPARFDGVLLPFGVGDVSWAVEATVEGRARVKELTLAEARLSDGQRLLAFNDLFVGARTHVSAHYRVRAGGGQWERQSSSGVIISTGAGATGWLSSVVTGARRLAEVCGGSPGGAPRLSWDDARLFFVVREPFASRHSQTTVGAGYIDGGAALELESLMPSGGVVFSDGVEDDALSFTSGLTAHIRPAQQRARVVCRTRA